MIKTLPLVLALSTTVQTSQLPVLKPVNMITASQTIVIRIGEYPDKPGKRIYLEHDELYLANNVPIRKDAKGYYVCEYDINKKLATKIYNNLQAEGYDVILLDAKDKTEDLNRAGRKAMTYNPTLYLSIHHNSYQDNSTGYFFMTNRNNIKEQEIAKQLSNSIATNPSNIRQMSNRIQDGYIGEMNETENTLNILFEGGFFSNKQELYKITSEEHTDYVAHQLATELVKVLSNI